MQCSYGNYYQHRYSLSAQLKPAAIARIAGTRISVQQIATLHKQGLSVTDIIAEYTFLNLAPTPCIPRQPN